MEKPRKIKKVNKFYNRGGKCLKIGLKTLWNDVSSREKFVDGPVKFCSKKREAKSARSQKEKASKFK